VADRVAARANLSARRVTVTSTAGAVPAERIMTALAERGFKAAELSADLDKSAGAADRDFLRRVGVAGFAAANIMLLSVSVWSGAAGDMDHSRQRRVEEDAVDGEDHAEECGEREISPRGGGKKEDSGRSRGERRNPRLSGCSPMASVAGTCSRCSSASSVGRGSG
jgi:hypothetical protein